MLSKKRPEIFAEEPAEDEDEEVVYKPIGGFDGHLIPPGFLMIVQVIPCCAQHGGELFYLNIRVDFDDQDQPLGDFAEKLREEGEFSGIFCGFTRDGKEHNGLHEKSVLKRFVIAFTGLDSVFVFFQAGEWMVLHDGSFEKDGGV